MEKTNPVLRPFLILGFAIGGALFAPFALMMVFGIGHGGPLEGTWLGPAVFVLVYPAWFVADALASHLEITDGFYLLIFCGAIQFAILGVLVSVLLWWRRRSRSAKS